MQGDPTIGKKMFNTWVERREKEKAEGRKGREKGSHNQKEKPKAKRFHTSRRAKLLQRKIG